MLVLVGVCGCCGDFWVWIDCADLLAIWGLVGCLFWVCYVFGLLDWFTTYVYVSCVCCMLCFAVLCALIWDCSERRLLLVLYMSIRRLL